MNTLSFDNLSISDVVPICNSTLKGKLIKLPKELIGFSEEGSATTLFLKNETIKILDDFNLVDNCAKDKRSPLRVIYILGEDNKYYFIPHEILRKETICFLWNLRLIILVGPLPEVKVLNS